MTIEEFQDLHGAQFGQVLRLPSFNAALVFLSLQVCESIKLLNDDQIRENAPIILADLRGRLRHEHELVSLPIPQEQPNQNLQEEYVDQVKEHFEQFEKNHPKL